MLWFTTSRGEPDRAICRKSNWHTEKNWRKIRNSNIHKFDQENRFTDVYTESNVRLTKKNTWARSLQ